MEENCNSELPQAKLTHVENEIPYICDLGTRFECSRKSARIQPLLRGHK